MKVIIPLAGKGTRLRPLTHTVPKPLLRVGGKAVLDYVVEDVLEKLDVEQLIFITGHLGDMVEAHVREHYGVEAAFVEQEVQDGTAGAINLARPYADGPLLIIFVDTLFEADLSVVKEEKTADGLIWAKEVEDYQRFGVIVTDDEGYMERIVEKPSEPISRLANIGVYYIRNHELLFEGIDDTLAAEPRLGEYFLTDAFQYMIEQGARIRVPEVEGWYDCGKPETMLATNRHLLESGRALAPSKSERSRIEGPVRIEDGATLVDSTVGPNVSVASGTRIVRSTVRDCIIERDVVIENCRLNDSLLGARVELRGIEGTVLLGDDSVVQG